MNRLCLKRSVQLGNAREPRPNPSHLQHIIGQCTERFHRFRTLGGRIPRVTYDQRNHVVQAYRDGLAVFHSNGSLAHRLGGYQGNQ